MIRDFGWFSHSKPEVNPILVTDGGLALSQTPYIGSGVGNAAAVDSTGSNENRPFNESVSSGNVYLSFLMEVPEEVNSGNAGFFIHLGEYEDVQNPDFEVIASAFRARTFVAPGDSPDKFRLGLNFNAAAVPTSPSNLTDELDLNETYLVVVKYEIVPGANNDLVSLYVFADGDDISAEPATADIGPIGGSARDLEAVQLVALRQYTAEQNIIVDGIFAKNAWDLESEEVVCTASGGTLVAASPVRSFCVGTGTPVGLSVSAQGASGSNQLWALTDNANGNVIATRTTNSNFNLDVLTPGNYAYRYIRFEDDVSLAGISNVSQASSLTGCFGLASNVINVFLRNEPSGGTLSAVTSTTVCAGVGPSVGIEVAHSGAEGDNSVFGLVEGAPGTSVLATSQNPVFNLNNFAPGNYRVFHLSYQQGVNLSGVTQASDLQGCFDLSNSVNVTVTSCPGAALSSSPNPSSGQSFVSFSNPKEEMSSLEVYDMSGKLVRSLFRQVTSPDQEYRLEFDGSALPNGVYIYRLTTSSEVVIDKFVISR